MGRRIEQVHVWIVTSPSGDERIIAAIGPLIHADRKVAEAMEPLARKVTSARRRWSDPIELRTFRLAVEP